MKVSYRWLCDVAPGLELSPGEMVQRLALRGAPVERVIDLGRAWRDVYVARVRAARPHPNADRLTLCLVEGPQGEVPVVCGAPNVQVGAYHPFVGVGGVLPGGLRIEKRKIRGEISQGMLCSERELEVGSDGDRILALDGDLEVGQAFAQAMGLDDTCLDIEVTPNRGDLLSHVGVARELHPGGDTALVLPELAGPSSAAAAGWVRGATEVQAGGVRVCIEDPQLCPRYLGAVITNVSVGPSPRWLADRLSSVGMRPVNNVVDATNYVMLELGQPLHAFDLARLRGSTVSVGPARDGELLTTLNGQTHTLASGMLLIRDDVAAVAVAGVMGGADSEVTDATEDVVLECALFEPKQVHATRRALGLSTDASYRFERGVDPESMEIALRRAAALIEHTSKGSLHGEFIDVCPAPWSPPTVKLRPSRVAHLLGQDFSVPEIRELLTPLGYRVERVGPDALDIRVPGHRSYDTLREVDLIEEVARSHGYDAFASEMAPGRPGSVPDHPSFRLADRLRAMMVGEGLSEAQTPALGPASAGDVELLNPMSRQESHLRRDRLSGLLSAVEMNMARGVRDIRLFEIGTAFSPGANSVPVETTRLAVVLTGGRAPEHWSGSSEPFDVYDVAHVLDRIRQVAYPEGRVVPSAGPPTRFVPQRSYELRCGGGRPVGWAGELVSGGIDLPPWARAVLGAEILLPDVPAPESYPIACDLPDQPAAQRDLAFLVPFTTPVGDVLEAAGRGAGRFLEDVSVFDLYVGDDLPSTVRSVALRLRFRARERTLTERDVDQACRRVMRTVKERTGVEPRG